MKPAQLGELGRRRGYVLSVGALGLRWGLNRGGAGSLSVVVSGGGGAAAAWGFDSREWSSLVGLLLSAPLLLPEQLLSL